MYRYINIHEDIKRRVIIGIDSDSCGGWEVPRFAMHKTVWVQRPENGETMVYVPGYKSPRTRNSDVQGQEKMHIPNEEERIWSPFAFGSICASKRLDEAYPYWWGQSLYLPTKSNVSLFEKHPQRYTQKQHFASSLRFS